jgi:hypothetical protein
VGDRGGTVFNLGSSLKFITRSMQRSLCREGRLWPEGRCRARGDSTVDALLGARLFIEVELAGPVHRRWPQWAFGFDQKRRAFEALRSV